MDTFLIDNDALKYAWKNADEYWFSLKTFKIFDSFNLDGIEMDENVSKTAHLISLGFIPYVNVNNLEVIRAFVETIDNKKLKSILSNIGESEYSDTFWKYMNVYPLLANRYSNFEHNYVLNKVIDWCNENGINYKVK